MWQPKPGQLRPGETIVAPYTRKMEAIGARRLLRQTAGVVCELRRLQSERDWRWCVIVREKR